MPAAASAVETDYDFAGRVWRERPGSMYGGTTFSLIGERVYEYDGAGREVRITETDNVSVPRTPPYACGA